jgi:hypothetical protein
MPFSQGRNPADEFPVPSRGLFEAGALDPSGGRHNAVELFYQIIAAPLSGSNGFGLFLRPVFLRMPER